MRLKIFLFISQWIIFCGQFNFAIVKAISGENVRLAREGEFSCVVSIKHRIRRRNRERIYHICTGGLVTKTHVLTAAHCFDDLRKYETVVVVGSVNLANGVTFNTLWWITYNEWINYKQMHLEFRRNDMAVLKLTAEVPDTIQFGVISPLSNPEWYGATVTIAGWSESNNYPVPSLMETVQLTILTMTECEDRLERLHGSRVPLHIRLLCSSANPCALFDHGDSGGPVMSMNTIIGVNQATLPITQKSPHPDKVNVHCGVDYYRNFILEIITTNFTWS